MNKNIFIIILATVAIIGIYFFSNIDSSRLGSNNKKLQISASFYPLYYFASEIGGDKAQVIKITPAGSEPHDYEPTTKDIAEIYHSEMIVVNGAGFEPWYSKIKDDLLKTNIMLIDATGGMELKKMQSTDPHVWLDPILAKQQADRILAGFTQIDSRNAEFYKVNAQKLQKEFDKLDHEYMSKLQFCKQKEFVTSHAAFGYLADRYGLTQISIAGVSPDEEPTPAKLGEVTKFAREHNVKYIFFETLVSPKLSETIANEVGAKTLVLDPLEGLSDDDKKLGKNYFTVMEDNLKTLQEALQCSK